MKPAVVLYGAAGCHKTQFYQRYLKDRHIPFAFKDVRQDDLAAQQLKALYTSGRLNFPTLVVAGKKLRNPSTSQLEKWLIKKNLLTA